MKRATETRFCKPLFLLARPAGLEPATYGFEVRRSIQLSYGRVNDKTIAAMARGNGPEGRNGVSDGI
jgi:hypothetical protein